MGDVHYLKNLPTKIRLSQPPSYKPTVPTARMCTLDRATFNRLGDYTRSMPTGPSAGRIYRRNMGWPADMPDNWFVYIVINSPDGDGQLHVPYSADIKENDCART